MLRKILIVAVATLLFSSKLCAQTTGAGFVLPTIPESLTTTEERANYLALHYWDEVDMTSLGEDMLVAVQQAFADFVTILPYTAERPEAFRRLWQRCYPHDMFYKMLEFAELYLYDVVSPLRNEEYYIEALEAIRACAEIDDTDKLAATSQLEMLKRNRVGEVVADFAFVDKQGAEHRLSDYTAEYVVLMFLSADCEDCKRLKHAIDANTRLWAMLRRGTLHIVAITITDDESAWLATTTPDRWTEGWDRAQHLGLLYDLGTLPRLYLLDGEHRVILKNTTPSAIEEYFRK
ncbi:MAG: DUF5106 domain-containing protein [Alistipes sp.]|nr:DUF5106 domain-containing protein [Alistipes sp.]